MSTTIVVSAPNATITPSASAKSAQPTAKKKVDKVERVTPVPPETKRKCKKCGKILPASDFYRNHAASDGYDNACKECRKQQAKLRQLANRAETISAKHAAQYNISELSDDALASELRRRGFTGELIKTFTVTV